MKKADTEAPRVAPIAPVLLLALAVAESLLSLYQWMELVLVRSGGKAICSVTATVNCATVWNSAFASRVHDLLGVPIAALGLVWGLTAFGLALALSYRQNAGHPTRALAGALKVTSAVGALSCVSFGVGSVNAGALCLTCLTTFALVLGFAGVTFKLLPGAFPPPTHELKGSLGWSAGLAVAFYLALLYPGLQTPGARTATLEVAKPTPGSATAVGSDEGTRQVAEFLTRLPPVEQQALSDTLAAYRRSPVPDLSAFQPRARRGPANAPTRVVDFTDVRCGHCRALVGVMKQLEEAVPPGALSVEARQFPLDGECNRVITRTDGSGLSCLGAKAQICLEAAPDFWDLREKLFAAQDMLTKDLILQIASSGSMSRDRLAACIASAETQAKLEQDIAYAMVFKPDGTPLVLVNGREGSPAGGWLYAMAMARGDPESKAFSGLPPPR